MQDKNWLVGIVAIFALVGVIVFVPKPQPTVVLVTTAGAEKAEVTTVDQSEAVFGLSQKASKFTDVEVTNELLVHGPFSVEGDFNYFDTLTALTVTTTLTEAQSGETFLVSGGLSTWTLPATSSLQAGTNYTFRVGGSLTVTSTIVVDGGWNGIEGTLLVAGAVVDCAAEDTLTFGASFENVGDYVEFIWSGTNWLLGVSGVLTANALTCTAT